MTTPTARLMEVTIMFAATSCPGTRWPAIGQDPYESSPSIQLPVSVVEVRPKREGVLDKSETQTLIDRLFRLADDPASGDVVIDLSEVTSITAQFLNIVDHFARRLAYQNRRLALWGIQTQCGRLLCQSGLNELVDCHPVRQSLRHKSADRIGSVFPATC